MFRRGLGQPALFAIVYTSVASAIYFSLGVVASRALGLTPVVYLLAGIFFGAEAFLPLTLSTTHGLSPTLAGLPLTFGALGWFVGSWVQGHWGQRSRYPLVRAGFVLVAVGVGGQSLLAVPGWPASGWWCSTGWWPAPGWWWRWGRSPCSCWSCPLSPSKGELGRAADHRRRRQHGLYRCRRRGAGDNGFTCNNFNYGPGVKSDTK